MGDIRFVHLHAHTDYSIIDGLMDVKTLIKRSVGMGFPAVAITDHMNQCNAIKLYEYARPLGIKPIFGIEVLVWDDTRYTGKKEFFKLVLLAENNEGYRNIVELQSDGWRQHKINYQDCVCLSWFPKYSNGVIVLSDNIDGDIGLFHKDGRDDLAEERIKFYKENFPDRFYFELTRMEREGEESYIEAALKWAVKYDLPVVATNPVIFPNEDDYEIHRIRVAIQDKVTLGDKKWNPPYTKKMYMRSQDEMCSLFSDIPEAVENSVAIAERCTVTMKTLGKSCLPKFPTGGLTDAEYLKNEAYSGLEKRLHFLYPKEEDYKKERPKYIERLERELKVIIGMDFPGYFLIVMEFIQWSKDHGVMIGPGRGSGGGSLVAYAIRITDFDPLRYDLLFERFLNPERISMPDFDVDMDDREKVIKHVAALYGRDSVSQIITFGTLAAKNSVRSVARVLGKSNSFGDSLAKLLPVKVRVKGKDRMDYTLAQALLEPEDPQNDTAKQFRERYNSDEETREVVDIAKRIQGLTTSHGKHAGGVVISPTVITDFAPLMTDEDGHVKTQFDKHDVEEGGLVKFDFLGLKTLTIIHDAVDMIDQHLARENKPPLELARIDLADKASYDTLKSTETTAVFQLESTGMRELIGKLQPDCFEDVIALVALYRPGPLGCGMVDNFVNRKHGKEPIAYPDVKFQHDCLKPILTPTYGVIIYQEQVMQIAQALAGYTLGGADLLRRAMGKKQLDVMAQQRTVFKEGAEKKNINGDLALKIFDMVEKFAEYGFNKSHSAAYALVCFQTLWLKTHYPAEFLAAMMTSEKENTANVVTYINECRRIHIIVDPPDLNEGEIKFIVNKEGHIVFSLAGIKGVGEGPVEAIMEERKKKPFRNMFDFCRRVDSSKVSRRVLEALIMAGAMDKIGPHRAAMMAAVDEAMRLSQDSSKDRMSGAMDLFGGMQFEEFADPEFPNVPHYPDKVWLKGEIDTLGLYLTGHPIDRYAGEIRNFAPVPISQLRPSSAGWNENREKVYCAGIIVELERRTTKSGMLFMSGYILDYTGKMFFSLWREQYEKYKDELQDNMLIVVHGVIVYDDYNKSNKILPDEIFNVEESRLKSGRAVRIGLSRRQLNDSSIVNSIQKVAVSYPGTMSVEFLLEDDGIAALVPSKMQVDPCDELLDALKMDGKVRVAVSYGI